MVAAAAAKWSTVIVGIIIHSYEYICCSQKIVIIFNIYDWKICQTFVLFHCVCSGRRRQPWDEEEEEEEDSARSLLKDP